MQTLGLNTLVEMVGAREWELEALRLAGHQCSMIVSSQSDLNLLSPCGFPVCRSVGSVSKPVPSTPSLSLPSAASGGGVSLGLLAWACQAVTSLLSGSTSARHAWPAPWGRGMQRGLRGPVSSCAGTLFPDQEPRITCAFPSIPEQQPGKMWESAGAG